MIPQIFAGKPIYANDLRQLIDEVKSNRLTSVIGGSFIRGVNGTCLKIDPKSGGGGGGGEASRSHPFKITLNKESTGDPDKPEIYKYSVQPLSYLFGSIHYYSKIAFIDEVTGVEWNQENDVVWIEVKWGDEGAEYKLTSYSSGSDWGEGEIEATIPEDGTVPIQIAARLAIAFINAPVVIPNKPVWPPTVEQYIMSHLRLSTSFGEANGIMFDAVVFADHASVDPQERFRSAFGNSSEGWSLGIGKGYSTFAPQSIEYIKNLEIAAGDPNNDESSGLSLIVGDLPAYDIFQLYSGPESERRKIFGKWTTDLKLCLEFDDATAFLEIEDTKNPLIKVSKENESISSFGKLEIPVSGNPNLTLKRTDYDVGAVMDTMGLANTGATEAPLVTIYSNTDYAYLSLFGSNSMGQLRIADREQDTETKVEIDKWSIFGKGPLEQEFYAKWANDIELKMLDGNTGVRLAILDDIPQFLMAQNWEDQNSDAVVMAHLHSEVPGSGDLLGAHVSVLNNNGSSVAIGCTTDPGIWVNNAINDGSCMTVMSDYIQRYIGGDNPATTYALFAADGAGAGDILYWSVDQKKWISAGISCQDGDILYFYGGGWNRLEKGTTGKVLTCTATSVEWGTGGGLPSGGQQGDVLRMGAAGAYWDTPVVCACN